MRSLFYLPKIKFFVEVQNWNLPKDHLRHLIMSINLDHTSIIDEKISPLALAVRENILFCFGTVTFAPCCRASDAESFRVFPFSFIGRYEGKRAPSPKTPYILALFVCSGPSSFSNHI